MSTVISACIHPCNTNTFIHSLTRTYLLQLKTHSYLNGVFLKSKNFLFMHKGNFNPNHKLSADINVILFLRSFVKSRNNIPTGNSFLIFNRFWKVRFSDKCHFIVTAFLLEKSQYRFFFTFSVLPYKCKHFHFFLFISVGRCFLV